MHTSELRALQIFNSCNLKDEDEEVKRNLMILLLSVPPKKEPKKSWASKFAGRWNGDETAEEIMSAIYDGRTSNSEVDL